MAHVVTFIDLMLESCTQIIGLNSSCDTASWEMFDVPLSAPQDHSCQQQPPIQQLHVSSLNKFLLRHIDEEMRKSLIKHLWEEIFLVDHETLDK
jgi:hypothetical protein